MSEVITEAAEVTADRLTNVLRRNFAEWNGEVSAVRVAFVRTLPYSQVARLEIEYASEERHPLPESIFLKLSSSNAQPGQPENSEADFYSSVGVERHGAPLIRCYDAAFSSVTGKSHLLLEDLYLTHFQTEQGEHPSPLYSELAVKSLASFHALWWEHPNIGNGIGRVFDNKWLESFLANLEASVSKFCDLPESDLTTEQRRAFEHMLSSSREIWGRLTDSSGLTVTHGDMHWWNFLHPNDPATGETQIFDWQLWHIDLGARDLAFLIALGGFAERRPELETHLLRTYHATLVDRGVPNYSWADFWYDYRCSAVRNLNIPVIFWSQGKHLSTWKNVLARAFQSYNELKCSELF